MRTQRTKIGTRKKPFRGRERPPFCRYITGQNPYRMSGVAPVHDCGCAYLFLAGTCARRPASSCASTSASKLDDRSDSGLIIAIAILFPLSQSVALARGCVKARRRSLRPLRGAKNAALTHPLARVRSLLQLSRECLIVFVRRTTSQPKSTMQRRRLEQFMCRVHLFRKMLASHNQYAGCFSSRLERRC